jgi:hypothetical protein
MPAATRRGNVLIGATDLASSPSFAVDAVDVASSWPGRSTGDPELPNIALMFHGGALDVVLTNGAAVTLLAEYADTLLPLSVRTIKTTSTATSCLLFW